MQSVGLHQTFGDKMRQQKQRAEATKKLVKIRKDLKRYYVLPTSPANSLGNCPKDILCRGAPKIDACASVRPTDRIYLKSVPDWVIRNLLFTFVSWSSDWMWVILDDCNWSIVTWHHPSEPSGHLALMMLSSYGLLDTPCAAGARSVLYIDIWQRDPLKRNVVLST